MVDSVTKEEFYARVKIAIRIFGEYLVQEIAEKAPVNEGYLKNNIRLGETSDTMVEIVMPDYALYVEYGSNPHMPPVDAIAEWAKQKGIGEEFAWPIALSIKERGTKAHPFIRPVLKNRLKPLFEEAMKDAFS